MIPTLQLARVSLGGPAGPPLTLIPGFNYTALYSMALRNAAYAGPCLRVIRASDSATQDIGFGTDGWIDAAAITAFIAGADLFCDRWYDQSGNGLHAANNTSGERPKLASSGGAISTIGGKPALAFDGSNDGLQVAATASFGFGTAAMTVEAFIDAVPNFAGSDNTVADMRTGGGSQNGVFLVDGLARLTYYNGSSLTGATTLAGATLHHVEWTQESATFRQFLNGTMDGSMAGVDFGSTRPLALGTKFIASNSFLGSIVELGILNGTALHTANFTPRSYL